MSAREEIERILTDEGGVFVARENASLLRTAQRLAAEGALRLLLPGIYCRWQDSAAPEVTMAAAARWAPDAVLTGYAAARLTYWPDVGMPYITLSAPKNRQSRPGFRVTREAIDPSLVTEVGGCRVTIPALTALDLALDVGGQAIDHVLRLRRASLDEMAEVLRLTNGRSGNTERRRWLLDSRDEPWSEAEREGHQLLRAAGITGWRGNLPVHCGERLFYLDIGFEDIKLGIEIDGREVHRAENVAQFHADRFKWTTMSLHGWMLLHFGATHVFDEGEWFVHSVRHAAVLRRRQTGELRTTRPRSRSGPATAAGGWPPRGPRVRSLPAS